jgi:hypothetical protein
MHTIRTPLHQQAVHSGMDCLVSSDLLARGLVLLSDIVSDTTVGGGQSGGIELASVIEVSDKGGTH